MTANPKSIDYICECGKKWRVSRAALDSDARWQCECGRPLVVQYGAIFSYPKSKVARKIHRAVAISMPTGQ